MGHVSVKVSPDGEQAVAWFNDDESDVLHLSGPAHTVDAMCRAIRSFAPAIEHEMSQRGVNREPFESDLTAAEKAEAAKAAAEAKTAAETQAKTDALKEQLDIIEKARRAIASMAPDALADADAVEDAASENPNTSGPG